MTEQNPCEMNGPVELEMRVWIINDEKQQAGQAIVPLGVFKYVNPETIANALKKFEETGFIGPLEGFRLMTKKEAWSAMVQQRFGVESILSAHDEWDDPCDNSTNKAYH